MAPVNITSQSAVVALDYRKVRKMLNRTLPFYQLYVNGTHAETYLNNVKVVVDSEVFTCRMYALVGDEVEPILVVLRKIYDPGPTTTLIVLDFDEDTDGGRLVPRQMLYTMPCTDAARENDERLLVLKELI
jgi:hypothetical protein